MTDLLLVSHLSFSYSKESARVMLIFQDVCYKPASSISDEAKAVRIEAFNSKRNTTHDPANFRVRDRHPPSDHPSYEAAIKRPLQDPVLSKRARELIGLDTY